MARLGDRGACRHSIPSARRYLDAVALHRDCAIVLFVSVEHGAAHHCRLAFKEYCTVHGSVTYLPPEDFS